MTDKDIFKIILFGMVYGFWLLWSLFDSEAFKKMFFLCAFLGLYVSDK